MRCRGRLGRGFFPDKENAEDPGANNEIRGIGGLLLNKKREHKENRQGRRHCVPNRCKENRSVEVALRVRQVRGGAGPGHERVQVPLEVHGRLPLEVVQVPQGLRRDPRRADDQAAGADGQHRAGQPENGRLRAVRRLRRNACPRRRGPGAGHSKDTARGRGDVQADSGDEQPRAPEAQAVDRELQLRRARARQVHRNRAVEEHRGLVHKDALPGDLRQRTHSVRNSPVAFQGHRQVRRREQNQARHPRARHRRPRARQEQNAAQRVRDSAEEHVHLRELHDDRGPDGLADARPRLERLRRRRGRPRHIGQRRVLHRRVRQAREPRRPARGDGGPGGLCRQGRRYLPGAGKNDNPCGGESAIRPLRHEAAREGKHKIQGAGHFAV